MGLAGWGLILILAGIFFSVIGGLSIGILIATIGLILLVIGILVGIGIGALGLLKGLARADDKKVAAFVIALIIIAALFLYVF